MCRSQPYTVQWCPHAPPFPFRFPHPPTPSPNRLSRSRCCRRRGIRAFDRSYRTTSHERALHSVFITCVPAYTPHMLQMLQEEGIYSFFRSYRATLVLNVPFTAMHLSNVPPCLPSPFPFPFSSLPNTFYSNQMLQEEGIYSFYRSYRTTLVMNVPFTAVHFATYEASKAGLGRALPGEALPGEGVLDEDRLLTHVLAGGAAGALASAVTNPLDVVKTRLQCQGVCGVKRLQSASVTAALRSIVREEGWGALLRGMRARVLFHTPAAAIVWSTYEASKNLLRDL
ncbi:unnamed protein product [Closterium sp. NIES-65]|nr:unnamed protein product [Closterium sp. NIES-65]